MGDRSKTRESARIGSHRGGPSVDNAYAGYTTPIQLATVPIGRIHVCFRVPELNAVG